jgi:Tol biopolymer transport system component/DNA-binding winged helix-turn-helix (wHTH) protein
MYDLLLVLVENPDRVIEKEYLLQTVWPDSFVEEGNITFNIRQLRKALGDDAQSPSYIETIPRRGYRFVAKVERAERNGDSETEQIQTTVEPVAESRDTFRRRIEIVLAGFVFLIAIVALAAWLARTTAAEGAPILSAPFVSEKLSTDGQVFQASISPDGKTLIYSHRNGNKQSLWIRQLETSNNVQIVPPLDTFYGGLAVSPDGNFVYFTRGPMPRMGRQIDLYRMPIVGGVPQKIVEGTQGWISASPDGQRISYVRCPYNEEEYCSLWVSDTDGKNEKKLVDRQKPFRIADNKISPDGKSVAFAVGQSRTASNEFEFHTVDIDTGAERILTPQKFFNISYITWLPDQSGLLLTARRLPDKNFRIWQVSAATGEASVLTDDSETYFRLSLDAKATQLVTTRVEPDFHLSIYQTSNPEAPPKILGNASTVTFAPNGRIVFSSIMTGDQEIWSVNPDGTDQRQLTNDTADEIAPLVSPDNASIYFDSNRTGEIAIWRMDPDGSDQRKVTTTEGGFPLMVSPDGQWLYYRSGLNNTLRRVSIKDGKEELVYDTAGNAFAISPDCTKLAISEYKNGNVYSIISLVDGKTEKTFTAADATANNVYLMWSLDGRSVIYALADDNSDKRTVWSQSLDGDKPRQIADFNVGEISELSGLAFSPDGQTFAVVQGNWNHNAVLIKGLKSTR